LYFINRSDLVWYSSLEKTVYLIESQRYFDRFYRDRLLSYIRALDLPDLCFKITILVICNDTSKLVGSLLEKENLVLEACFLNVDKTTFNWNTIEKASELHQLCVLLKEKNLNEQHRDAPVKSTLKPLLLAFTQDESLKLANEITEEDKIYSRVIL
jgi:hypothetical protein